MLEAKHKVDDGQCIYDGKGVVRSNMWRKKIHGRCQKTESESSRSETQMQPENNSDNDSNEIVTEWNKEIGSYISEKPTEIKNGV